MGFYLQADGEEIGPLASNTGWGDFGRWAKTLDPDEYPQIRGLHNDGWSDEPGELARELSQCDLSDVDDDTVMVHESLSKMLNSNEECEVVSVTDGMGGEQSNVIKASTADEDKLKKKRERQFLVALIAYFLWQQNQLTADPTAIPTSPFFTEKLSLVLANGMMHAAPDVVAAPEIIRQAILMAAKLNDTTAKNITAKMADGATREAAISDVLERAVSVRSALIEGDMIHVAEQVETTEVAKVEKKRLIWRTERDEIVCQDVTGADGVVKYGCAGLDGIIVNAGEEFKPGIRYPVVDTHGSCRCVTEEIE